MKFAEYGWNGIVGLNFFLTSTQVLFTTFTDFYRDRLYCNLVKMDITIERLEVSLPVISA
ncbi:MAG: hypothetical protein ABIN24_03460 [Dyadobacter sp.]